MLKEYQKQFIDVAQNLNALKFGEFTLKSGRKSPYFFNAGCFNTGNALGKLANCYTDKILESNMEFDVLFGPAYKGIPLVAAVSVILSQKTGKNIPWAFNRKEKKAHGEGGVMVGSPIEGKLLIIDDVITAGTAIREIFDLLKPTKAIFSGVLVALDRQEKSPNSDSSAMQVITQEYGVETHAILSLNDLIIASEQDKHINPYMKKLKAYREKYGI